MSHHTKDNIAKSMVADADNCDDRVLESLRRIIRAVDLYSRYLVLRHNLTGPQLVCVRHLLRFGPTPPGTLARRVSLSPATVTGIVDRLEKRGLVTRERSHADKRMVEIALTEVGREIATQMPPPLHETFSRRLGELPVEEQQEIDRVLAKIVAMMESRDFAVPELPAELLPPAATLSPFVGGGESFETHTPEPDAASAGERRK